MKNQSSLFDGEMALTMIGLIIVIIIERIANRTDTKGVTSEKFEFS